MDPEIIELDQGWDKMQEAITKLKNFLEEQTEQPFSSEEYMMLYTTIYIMCTQKPPHDYSQQLYDKYRGALQEYITSTVLPSLRDKHAVFMLRELVKRWSNYKVMVHFLSRFFRYLDKNFIARRSLPTLNEVGLTCFREKVYTDINGKVRDAVLALINKEREGEQIDRALLKNVLDIFVEIDMRHTEHYEKDFERPMLDDTGRYHSRKASGWILEDSCPDYMLKSEECLRKERERVSHYLHSSSEPKLVEKVQHELLVVFANQLLAYFRCHALFRDDKVADLSRRYRLFHKIPKPLESIANAFKQHVTNEGTVLVQQAEDAASNRVLPPLKDKHDEFMLRELVKRWVNHKVMVQWLLQFFHYHDRYFIARRSLSALNEVGLTCFRDQEYNEINGKVKDSVITLIYKEREGEQIDRALLKNVLDIFVEIDMEHYEKDFEKPMLDDTGRYYSRKASSWILEDSCPDYMLKSEECLRKERERVSHYLHSSSEPKLVEKVQHELLVVFAQQLLEKEHSGCRALLRDDKVDDLSRMYRLYHKIPKGLEPIANTFKQHVTNEGTVLVQQAEDAACNQATTSSGAPEQVLIRKIIELHDKYMAYVTDCFSNNTLFDKALKEAFEVFCNKTVAGGSSAELLATFCDNILKKGGSEKLGDEVIEERLEKVVKLLAYISDKDLFAEFCRKKLARRLLFDCSANDDHERSILTKLKQQCGGQFTSKMEGMVTDLTLARENQTGFEGYLSSNPAAHPGLDLTVTVLTTGFWPSYKSFDLNLPAEMVRCVEVFKGFYETKTKHRKLTWIYSLGTCHVNGKFEQKTIELVVSTYQAAVLLLFNSSDRLSYSEIMAQLNLTHDDLVRLLHSLSCAKYKILTKEPNTRTISQTDSFEFNSKFTDRMRRIKIPLPPVDERKKVVEDVDKDRRYAIDAALVRIMKSRKVLGHQQLVSECVEQLSRMFKPDIKAIKKRMEDLITRDYLERDKENPNLFRYLA